MWYYLLSEITFVHFYILNMLIQSKTEQYHIINCIYDQLFYTSVQPIIVDSSPGRTKDIQ